KSGRQVSLRCSLLQGTGQRPDNGSGKADKPQAQPFRHAKAQKHPADFGAVAIALQHNAEQLAERQGFQHIVKAGAAGRYFFRWQPLQPDMMVSRPPAEQCGGQGKQQGGGEPVAIACRCGDKGRQETQPGQQGGQPLHHAQRTRVQKHHVLKIIRGGQQADATDKPQQIAMAQGEGLEDGRHNSVRNSGAECAGVYHSGPIRLQSPHWCTLWCCCPPGEIIREDMRMLRHWKLLALMLSLLLPAGVQADDAPATDTTATDTAALAGPAKYIYMEPAFVVNYGSTGRMRYLRTEVVLRVSSVEAAARVSQHKPYLRNNLVMLFSAQEGEVMNSPQGRESLRKVALDEVRAVMQELEGTADIDDLYFSNFVVQN